MTSGGVPLVEMINMTKVFGGVKAVNGVQFEVHRNEVVALVGDNGAGKSTLIKLLAGVFPPEHGTIKFNGETVELRHPSDSIDLGIHVIYQDLSLVETFDLPSNFFLGNELYKTFGGRTVKLLDQEMMTKNATDIIRERLGMEINNWYQPVRVLSGGERQAIAVARAVYGKASIIVMDEPTAALGVSETERLFDMIRRLKEQDLAFIVIAHNLEHVFAIADRIVVLNHGRKMGSRLRSDTSREEIIQMMLGKADQEETA